MVLIGNYKILSEEISNVTTSMLAAANIIDGKSDDVSNLGLFKRLVPDLTILTVRLTMKGSVYMFTRS
jgi:hypothetical protein